MKNIADTTATAATPENVVALPTVEKKAVKKQHTLTARERDKQLIEELAQEFFGPSKSDPTKPKFLTSEEMVQILLMVATDARFKTVEVTDENGEAVYDEDGVIITETIDRIEAAANVVIAERDAVDLEKQIEAAKALLAAAQERKDLLAKLNWSDKTGKA